MHENITCSPLDDVPTLEMEQRDKLETPHTHEAKTEPRMCAGLQIERFVTAGCRRSRHLSIEFSPLNSNFMDSLMSVVPYQQNRARCPDLPHIEPGMLDPAGAFKLRFHRTANQYKKRVGRLGAQLSKAADFASVQRLLDQRLGVWAGGPIGIRTYDDAARVIVILGPKSAGLLVPQQRKGEGKFLERIRAAIDTAEYPEEEGSVSSVGSVGMASTVSKVASREIQRQAQFITHQAAICAQEVLRSAEDPIRHAAASAAAGAAAAAINDAIAPLQQGAAQASADAALRTLQSAEPALKRHMAEEARCAADVMGRNVAAAASATAAEAARQAAEEAVKPLHQAMAAVAAQAAQAAATARAAAREEMAPIQGALAALMAQVQALRVERRTSPVRRRHDDSSESSEGEEACAGHAAGWAGAPATSQAPALTSTDLYSLETWRRAVGTPELSRLAEELLAATPTGTARLYARAALDAAVAASNGALRRRDVVGATDVVEQVVRRVVAANRTTVAGLGKTDRGAREALAAVLEAEDLTLASTTKALRRVEGFSHPPHPGRGRWGASGNTSRGNSAARENPHAAAAAKSASKKPQRKPK
jgi:hypothetical protein